MNRLVVAACASVAMGGGAAVAIKEVPINISASVGGKVYAAKSLNGGGSSALATYMNGVDASASLSGLRSTRPNYYATSSGVGMANFTTIKESDPRALTYAGSDVPTTDSEYAAAMATHPGAQQILNIAIINSTIAVPFNLGPGVDHLNLDGPTLADIFLHKITRWNDPRIEALNPHMKLPHHDIILVGRSEKSGTVNGFTTFLSNQSTAFAKKYGVTEEADFGGIRVKGNDLVLATVNHTMYSIGFGDAPKAIKGGEAMANMANNKGQEVNPTGDGYPITLVSYAVVPKHFQDASEALVVKQLLMHAMSTAQQDAAQTEGFQPMQGWRRQNSIDLISSIS